MFDSFTLAESIIADYDDMEKLSEELDSVEKEIENISDFMEVFNNSVQLLK